MDQASRDRRRRCRTYLGGRVGLGRLARHERERGGVEAVAAAGRRRSIGEDVTEVPVAATAPDLDALHPVRAVVQGGEVLRIERLVERRPAGPGLELRARPEQRQAAEPAGVHAGLFVVQQAAAKWRLGAVIEQHAALLGGEVPREALALRRRQRTQVVPRLRARPHRRHYMILPRRWRSYGLSHARTDGAARRRSRLRL